MNTDCQVYIASNLRGGGGHRKKNPLYIEDPLKNIVGKGQNAGDQNFLLFPQFFLPIRVQIRSFSPFLTMLSKGIFPRLV